MTDPRARVSVGRALLVAVVCGSLSCARGVPGPALRSVAPARIGRPVGRGTGGPTPPGPNVVQPTPFGECWAADLPVAGCTAGHVSVASDFVCVDCDARVWCAGANESGQLGRPETAAGAATPENCLGGNDPFGLVPLPRPGRQLRAFGASACGITQDPSASSVWCWGEALGHLWARSSAPRRVSSLDGATQVESSEGVFCARWDDGTVRCWRAAPTRDARPAQRVTVGDAVDLALGLNHACVLTRSGEVSCWGTTDGRVQFLTGPVHPRPVAAPAGANQIALGAGLVCVALASDQVECAETSLSYASPHAGTVLDVGPFHPMPCLSDSRKMVGVLGCVYSWRRDGEIVGVGVSCLGDGAGARSGARPRASCEQVVRLAVASDAVDVAATEGGICWLDRRGRTRCRFHESNG